LGERLNDLVRATWREVDTVGVCLPADERIGPGDRFLIGEIARLRRKPVLAIATKIDLVSKERLAEHLASIQKAGDDAGVAWQDVVPVSAVAGEQIKLLADLLLATLPEGPPLYPEGQLTDEPEETLIAEVIREAALEGVRDELPHSIAVTVDEVIPGKTVKVHASLFVERDSQKGIVIGHKGARLREIGSASRSQIERILGSPVFLDLHVKVAKDWQRDPRQLRKLGF
ncbi:MAG TPA: GTPase Era, partial [Aeromicrobium sp.]|nr:GTPase Era [Aeromicrobium sp.]